MLLIALESITNEHFFKMPNKNVREMSKNTTTAVQVVPVRGITYGVR